MITIISDTAKSDASAADEYSKMSSGLEVCGRERKCLTTRNDGNITITFGESDNPKYRGKLHISTSK